MTYKFRFLASICSNDLYCIVNTTSKEYLVYKGLMYNKTIDDKVKHLTERLPNSDIIELRSKDAFEKLVKGLDSDEEFTRI